MTVAITQIATVTSQAMRDSGTGRLFSPTAHEPCPDPRAEADMTAEPVLTPPLALDYLRELSADIRSGVVLDADGNLLAGPEELGEAARDLMQAAGGAEEIHVSLADGGIFAARSDKHALVVVCGRLALPSLIRYDLRLVLADLGGGKRPDAPAAA
jgi:hypothetical protein